MTSDIVSAFACRSTISVPEALLFGAPDGACISLGFGTLVAGLAGFVIIVVTLQIVVKRLFFRQRLSSAGAFSDGPIVSLHDEDRARHGRFVED
jgi:hypothetical protein